MFIRIKKSGQRQYLQIVENRWENGGSRQRVIATLGRLDELTESGKVDGLLRGLSRYSRTVKVVEDLGAGRLEARSVRRIGPALVFERLWEETGAREEMEKLLRGRGFEFPVERAVFLSVLHRLFETGSDRQAERWRREHRIEGAGGLQLHHLYRAMRWLGEERWRIEEGLFARRRDLFATADLFFFDTTSVYFEGAGGESLGEYGYSKDRRPDRRQMIVGAVVDGEGRPLSAPMWPGNRADVTTLLPVADDLRKRFGVGRVCVVADRGMMAEGAVEELEGRGFGYIFGARMRAAREVREDVLSRDGRYREVRGEREGSDDPAPLRVKEVCVEGRRYVVCHNAEQEERDRALRTAVVDGLREQLRRGEKSLVGNKGYRKYLKSVGGVFEVDEAKVEEEARYDGKWVLRTNLELPAEEVALRYKELWKVERLFREAKSLLATRPIFHRWDATICGHVFVSFLALVMLRELEARMEAKGLKAEWADIRRDLLAVEEVEVADGEMTYWLRTPVKAGASVAFRAAGVAIPPSVREGSNA
jgi:transposase